MQKIQNPDNQSPHYIIAIGASAGGLEAIHEFFDNMPYSGSISFVIIQHLSPNYKSLLVELVARHTEMQVVEAGHNTEVKKGFIYVIPNNKVLMIADGRLMLGEKHFEKAPNTAIDLFLKSLAEDQGAKGIAVILSGTGTDGTRGAKAIKEAGGLVLVQDPLSAKFDGMPNSAIEAGHADFILIPELMPEEIFTYIKEEPVQHAKNGCPTEQNLPEVLDIVLNHYGHDFHNYKSPTLLRRIMHRMSSIGKKNFNEYLEFLRTDSKECGFLGNEFLIGVTRFFRDKAAFAILQNDILRRLIKEKEEGAVLKVWVTACSTGQEAYSIAIAIAEAQLAVGKILDVKIFATDIDNSAIDEAAKGSYPEAAVAEIEPQLIQKYFTRQDGIVTVNSKIRKQIVFARQNILKDPPFIKNDLVSCRNMLIYMNPILQRQVFGKLQFGLNVGGYLFLGPSEVPGSIKENLEEVNGKWKLYKKVKEAVPNTAERYAAGYSISTYNTVKSNSHSDTQKEALHDDFQEILTEEYGFAAVYIDEACEIKEGVGDFRRYLSLPEKIGSLNVLKMVGAEVSAALNTAIRKARAEGRKITLNHTRIREGGTEKFINLYVKPTIGAYTIIVFAESHKALQKLPLDLLPQQHDDTAAYISELEEELKEAHINLQMASESMDTTNEELQSTNEELLSSNEELQSSNEELQSLNEELHTLNTEHQLRINELIDLNDDLNNYFRSTQIGQVFVDRDLRIRKFNPTAVQMINLIESDIGRPIEHISTNIRHSDLLENIRSVIREQKVVEKEIVLHNGAICLMRIQPYLRQDGKIDGIVMTFIDMTATKELDNIIKGVFNASLNAIMVFRSVRNGESVLEDFDYIAGNKAAALFLHRNEENFLYVSLKKELPGLMKHGLFKKFTHVVEKNIPLHMETAFEWEGVTQWYEVLATKMMDGFVVTFTNITEKKSAEEKIRKNYRELVKVKENLKALNAGLEEKAQELKNKNGELQQLIQEFTFVTDFMPQMVWATGADGYHDFFNKGWYNFTGLTYEQTNTEGWSLVLHPDDYERTLHIWHESLRSGKPYQVEYRMRRHDGLYFWFLARALPLRNEHGTIVKWFGTCTDINDQKTANDSLEQKVAERTQELQKINYELEISNTELLQFASVASHDLKEPLRKIQIFGSVLKNKYAPQLDENVVHYLDRIIDSSARMTCLINDLLNFSRISAVSLFEITDMNAIVLDVLQDLELLIKEKEAVIDTDTLPLMEVMPGLMRQAFQNIISNALKFTRSNVVPFIKIACARVDACTQDAVEKNDGAFYAISIKDNGIGFDEQYAGKIFLIFEHLHSREKYEGTGIGLAIAKKIIEKHNGLIYAKSEDGTGATFTMILPMHQHQTGKHSIAVKHQIMQQSN